MSHRTFLIFVLTLTLSACGKKKRTAQAISAARSANDAACTSARSARMTAYQSVMDADAAVSAATNALEEASGRGGGRPSVGAVKKSQYDEAEALRNSAIRRLDDAKRSAQEADQAEKSACQ